MEQIDPLFDRSKQVGDIKEVHFQALSWYGSDVEKEKYSEEDDDEYQYEIYISGVTLKSESVTLRVVGFKPFFYVEVPNNWTETKADMFFKGIKNKLYKEGYGLLKHSLISRKKLFPYLANREFKFVKLVFTTDKAFNKCKWLFSSKNQLEYPIKITGLDSLYYEDYESNVNHLNRFCHIREIETTGWISVKKFTEEIEYSNSQINITAEYQHVFPDETTKIVAPFTILSWDIECVAENTEEFPNPELAGDELKQISAVIIKYGTTTIQKFIFTCSPCSPIEGAVVVVARDEKGLLKNFCELIKRVDPDILTGYNTWGFDDKYFWTRVQLYGIESSCLSRITQEQPKLQVKELSSSAYGNNTFTYMLCPGRETFDLLVAIRRDHKLNSYSLNSVGEEFLKEHKVDLPYRELFRKLNGNPDEIAECAVYCIQDSNLVIRLIQKLSMIPNYIEMAKATFVPLEWLLFRGQQCKVFSLIAREARKNNYIVPVHKKQGVEKFQGATVISPLIGLHYDPIAGLDFASLYPSIMIAYNMCYSTIVNTPEMLKYVIENNIPHKTIEWDEEPETSSLISTKKHHSFTFVQIEDDKGVQIENGTRGILGIILMQLWKGRKATKKLMASEKDPFMYEVLNGKQLAQKITMNSIYGFTGADNGILPLKAIASSVTATGRKMIDQTSQMASDNFSAITIYGDSLKFSELITINDGKDTSIGEFGESVPIEWKEYRGFKIGDITVMNKEYKDLENFNYVTYTHEGYKPLKKIIRHKTNKKMYKITACDKDGILHSVTVTEGHSLINQYGKCIEAENLKIGDKLYDYKN